MQVLIWPFSKSFDSNWLTYLVHNFLEKEIKTWQIVEIPFKEDIILWVVLKIITSPQPSSSGEGGRVVELKPVISIFNENIFLSYL